MTRTSKKKLIIEAAFDIIDREGVRGLTYDSLAATTGLTKGGILYHFPSRDDLLRELHLSLAYDWKEALEESAHHADPASLTRGERLAAYVDSSIHAISRARLLLLMDSGDVDASNPLWSELERTWMPLPPSDIRSHDKAHGPQPSELSDKQSDDQPDDQDLLDDFIIRLAADGLWMYDTMNGEPLDIETKKAVTRRLLELRQLADDSRRASD